MPLRFLPHSSNAFYAIVLDESMLNIESRQAASRKPKRKSSNATLLIISSHPLYNPIRFYPAFICRLFKFSITYQISIVKPLCYARFNPFPSEYVLEFLLALFHFPLLLFFSTPNHPTACPEWPLFVCIPKWTWPEQCRIELLIVFRTFQVRNPHSVHAISNDSQVRNGTNGMSNEFKVYCPRWK